MDNILQQIEQRRVQEFLEKYRELVKEYGYDFAPDLKLIKIQIPPEPIIQPVTPVVDSKKEKK
jgi:hypothetical protein